MKALMSVGLGMFLMVAGVARAEGRYFMVEYGPSQREGELQIGVKYILWVPEGVQTLRGVIVHQHGCGTGACQGGATAAYDLQWQALARKWDCALLGPTYQQGEKQECSLWCDPRKGSDRAFLRGLKELGEQSGHPELERVPWCLWGHSGGGYWANVMVTLHPERVVACWFRSGTAALTMIPQGGELAAPAALREVPMMCNPGVKEKEDRFKAVWTGCTATFQAYRKQGAPIGFAADPKTSHECGQSRTLAIPFFDACLAMRLPEKGEQKLRALDAKQAWLGSMAAGTAAPAAEYVGKPEEAVYLPNEAVARAWMAYVKEGAVGDSTPPPGPKNVRVAEGAEGMEITWEAQADLESGIRGFVILRDGAEVGKVEGKPGWRLLQGISYHDTPESTSLALRYLDKAAPKGQRHTYRVVAVNGGGARSE